MLKKYFIMAITAIFALVACSEKFDEPGIQPAGSDNVHTLSVGIEAGTYTPAEGETKASMEAVIRVNWTEDDEVSVVNATKGKILGGCLKATASGTSVTFKGTVTGPIDNGDKLYYIYPRLTLDENEEDFGQSGYDVSLAGQTYDGENPGKVSFYGYAEDVAGTGTGTISKKIQFTLVTSYAHLNMANLPAKGFNLSSIDISKVNKGFKWSLSESGVLTADAYGENEGISVNCSNCKITQAGNAVVRFAIPASAATGSEPRVVTVNKAYTNDKYIKDQLIPSAYYNQLYTSWTNENVNVNSAAGDKTEVSIDNLGSTETAEGILPVSSSEESASAFNDDKPTEISLGGLGTITFNQQASNAIKNNAGESTSVFFKVEDVTQTKPAQNANLVYEITMKTLDSNGTEVFSKDNAGAESEATVVIELGQSVSSVDSVSLVDDNGQPVSGDAVKNVNFDPQTGKLTFIVVHFSKYAITYTEKQSEQQNYVAQIGGRKYETLASAIAAAQNGNTIQMIDNYTAPAKIEIGADKNIVLDLNGYTISYSTDKFEAFITNKESLRITDSSNGKNGKITATHSELDYNNGCYTIDNFGGDQSADKVSKLVIDAGTIENASTKAGLAWPVNNGSWNSNAELIINGGTIHSVNYVPVREYLQCGGKKTIVINGGKFISDNSRAIAVQVNDATIQDTGSSVTINGGEFTCNGSGILYVDMHAANANLSGFSMIVNGGKFKNNKTEAPVLVYDYESKDHDSAVLLSKILRGGTYSKEPASELLADGYELVDNQDAGYPYKVQQKPFVAKIGETGYISFVDAVAAVQANQTIEVLSDIALDGPITISKSDITIDGKEKTIAVSDAEYWNQYKVNGANQGLGKCNMISVSADNFTLKNVTLDGKDCRGVSLCTTTGGKNVLYQNVTYTGRGSGHYYGEATGLVTFDGCKFDIHGYAIHFGGESSLDDDVVIKNCEVNGWSSFGKCKSLTISDSHFGGAEDKDKNGWLAVLRPYCPTTITNCTFSDIYLHTDETNYECIGLGTGAATTVILNGCKVVDYSKQVKADVDIYSIVRDNGFDNYAAQNGSVFAFDAEGNAADGFKSGTFYAVTPANIKLQSGYAYHQIEGKENIYGIHEIDAVATIGSVKYETLDAATKAVQAGQTIEIVKAGTYTVPNISYNITVEGAVTDVVFNCAGSGSIASISNGATFKNVTMNFGQSNYHGFQHAGHIVMEGCTLNGLFFSYGNMTFNECIFNQEEEEYNMWTYAGHITYDGCTFNSKGKFLNIYRESPIEYEVVAKDCVFNTSKKNKAALNIKETCNAIFLKYNVTVENCSCNELQNSLENKDDGTLYRVSPIWQVDDRKTGETGINVTIDGLKVYPFCSKDADGNYHITNAAGLLQFHDLYAAGKVAYTAKVYVDNDIDFTGKTWTALDWHADGALKGFALFDGQNHTIKNFTVNGQGMFSRWACTSNIGATPYFKDIVFDGAKNVASTLNVSLFCGQVYQNAKIENVTIKNSQFEGTYKVAPFVGSVYDENGRGPILTLKDCKVENTTIKGTSYDKDICGMVAWVNESNNDKIAFEGNNVVKDVTLYTPGVTYNKCAKIYHNGNTAYDEATNVTVTNVNVIIAQ